MMKQIILFLALISSAGCVTETTHSQQQPTIVQTGGNQCVPTNESDWKLQDLKGKVKTVRTFKTWFSKNEKTRKIVEGEQELEDEFRYDSKGKQVAWKNTNYLPADPENVITPVYTFDDTNRLIKTVRTDKKNRLEELKIYTFDNAGRLLEELKYYNSCYTKDNQMCEGSLNTDIGVFNTGWKTVFTYDVQDNWIKQIEYQIFERNGEKSFEPSTALYRRLTYY